MCELSDFLRPDSVLTAVNASGKRQALDVLSCFAARQTGVDSTVIMDMLLQREALGSTGIGGGVAIPHAKLKGITRLYGAAAILEKPIDFNSMDGEPVDILFLLLAPEDSGADQLQALARIARQFQQQEFLKRIRRVRDPSALFILLTETAPLQYASA
ncbi:MAG: PTS sugar transporter subunit IIA [Methylobacteriaceae bacterium]|nr:PTS sugar transporter subunit IIA [Methylobacteriaceae bacterium]